MSSFQNREIDLIVAADVEREKLETLIQATCLVEGVGGYKIGKQLTFLPEAAETVAMIKDLTTLPVIYDDQKAATDIPKTGSAFAADLKQARIDTAIIFPLAGTETQKAYTLALQDNDIEVITGLHMTQPGFLVSEGGYVADDAPERAFTLATELGVTRFVLPGNKLKAAQRYIELLDRIQGRGNWQAYAPGFISQGGELSEFARLLGDRPAHAIVGDAIYNAVDMTQATEQILQQLHQTR